jgi:signal transduction histidine kinase
MNAVMIGSLGFLINGLYFSFDYLAHAGNIIPQVWAEPIKYILVFATIPLYLSLGYIYLSQKKLSLELQLYKDGLEVMVHDRTAALTMEMQERKELEKKNLEAKDRIILEMKHHEEYVKEVADRLRNPLQVIMGRLESLNPNGLTDEELIAIEEIKKSSTKIDENIKKLT